MARPLRIEYKGAVYHIISRGNRAEYIFADDKDKEYLIETLHKAIDKYNIELYAYCIMGNHYHLLMTPPYGELKKAMHYIGSTYGSYLVHKRGWIGHIFAGRYKSLCIEREGYLLELSRYIHLNPVRAGAAQRPEEYPWSSYQYYIGKKERPKWLNTNWLLEEYGRDRKTAYRKYREFTEAGMKILPADPKENMVGQAILGSKEFIKRVLKGIKKGKGFEEITAKRIYKSRISLEDLKDRICRYYRIKDFTGTNMPDVRHKRQMFIYLAKRETTVFNREIAAEVGEISPSGVSHQNKRILQGLEGDRKISRQWEKEAEEIMSRIKG